MARQDLFRVSYEIVIAESEDVRLARWARLSYPLLLLGETGTGKTRLAKLIHQLSGRPGDALTCSLAEMNDELASSDLFGHVKWAFTDAKDERAGIFEEAGKGTAIIEEIDKGTLRVQGKLLRVVEEKQVTRIGEHRPRPVHCRIIAVSNADIDKLVDEGKFLEDLRSRFGFYVWYIRPLRERRDLILPLAAQFLATESALHGNRAPPTLEAETERLLLKAHWSKNIRELENVCRYLVGNAGDVVGVGDLPREFLKTLGIDADTPDEPLERRVRRILKQVGDNKAKAARLLGMSRSRLYRVLEETDK